ncbi:MAG: hypothetical protein N3A61_09620, partial [Ignavibacteria bacterium]|nr:hypothetical protein [Ignavibacteria bacterium]
MKKIFTSFSVFALLVLSYSILRLLFFLINLEFFNEANSKDILTAFLIGIRFDISAIVMLNLPVLILYNLPFRIDKFKLFRVVLFALFCLLNILGLSLNIADFGYYPTIQRRLLYEPYSMLPDILRMFPGLFRNYWYLILGFLLASAGFVYFSLKFIRYLESKVSKSPRFVYAFFLFMLVSLLSVVGIRGGLQLKPLRQTNAFFSNNRALGFLALNSTYTVLRSYFQYT